jgi:hypothetical protein
MGMYQSAAKFLGSERDGMHNKFEYKGQVSRRKSKFQSNSDSTLRVSLNIPKKKVRQITCMKSRRRLPRSMSECSCRPTPLQSTFYNSSLRSKSMSTLVKAPSLNPEIADRLREELMLPTQDNVPREQPFYKLPSTSKTEKILKEYIQVYP